MATNGSPESLPMHTLTTPSCVESLDDDIDPEDIVRESQDSHQRGWKLKRHSVLLLFSTTLILVWWLIAVFVFNNIVHPKHVYDR